MAKMKQRLQWSSITSKAGEWTLKHQPGASQDHLICHGAWHSQPSKLWAWWAWVVLLYMYEAVAWTKMREGEMNLPFHRSKPLIKLKIYFSEDVLVAILTSRATNIWANLWITTQLSRCQLKGWMVIWDLRSDQPVSQTTNNSIKA